MILLRFLQVEERQCCVIVSELKEISTNKFVEGSYDPTTVPTGRGTSVLL